ncbi:MAG: LacI family DNA-binding transcriptional regulator [Chloroflexi bacterium]|nr:LacI family DNA-binding transcriptional regulator [Chloroflexota bacterium]
MPTLAEVAQKAGVSIATVSKVLSNTPYFTEETRRKVMSAVEELGYLPNLAARALSSGKTHLIGVIFPYVYEGIFTDPLVQYILEGVEAECNERGYNIVLSTPRLSPDGPEENYRRLLQSSYLDGIVALDNVPLSSVLSPSLRKNTPAVAIGYGDHPYFVRSDDLQGSTSLMEHVVSLGHRHIGILTVDESLHYSIQNRHLGLQTTAETAGLNYAQFPKFDRGDFSIASGMQGAAEVLNQENVTALVCINDRMALGAIQQVQKMGFRVPDDITVVGYDDILSAQLFSPALTTIDQRAPELGHQAAQMLFALLNNEIPDSVVIPTRLCIRESSAPPKSSR